MELVRSKLYKLSSKTTLKEDGQQLKLQYDNRKIQPGENITSFIEDLSRTRLLLKELNITLSDDDMVTKILHSMATTENQSYAGIRDAIIASEDPSKGITLSSLTQRLRKIDSVRAGTLSTNIVSSIQSLQTPQTQQMEAVNAVFRPTNKFKKSKPKVFKKSFKDQRHSETTKKNIRCYRCQGRNHTASECKTDWNRIKQREPRNHQRPHSSRPNSHRNTQHEKQLHPIEDEGDSESANMVSEDFNIRPD
jgi:hypothetical protein